MSTAFASSFKISLVKPFEILVSSAPGGRILRSFGPALLMGAGYYAGSRLGFAWTPIGQPNSTFWPPNAMLLAGLLLTANRRWWLLLLAVLPAHMLAQLQVGVPVSTAAGWFISNTSEALIAAFCISLLMDPSKMFDSVRGVFMFVVFAVLVAPFATSFLDAFVVIVTGWGRSYWSLSTERFWTNALAVLTIVPTVVLLKTNGRSLIQKLRIGRCCEIAFVALAIVSITAAVFRFESVFLTTAPALWYAPLPLLLWISARYGTGGLSMSALVIALMSTWYVIHGRDPFPYTSVAQNVLWIQVLLCILVVPLMLLSVVMAESRRTQTSLRVVSSKLIHAQERERARIARDLHDDIAQRLAMIAIEIQRFESEAPESGNKCRNRTAELHEAVVHISKTVHSLSHELHPSKVRYVGLVAAARAFCKDVSDKHNLEIDFRTDELPDPLSADISLCLFRVVQESVQNAVKHSGATRIQVQLRATSEEIHLMVIDSGKGFDAKAEMKAAGLGLISMQERMRLVKGEFSVQSQPNRGTTIYARVPLIVTSDSDRMIS